MMDDFFDEEAELGTSEEESGDEVREERGILSDDDDEEEERRRKKKGKAKKKKRRVDSDDDEEDGEDLDRDLEDLIDDNPIEEGEDSEGEGEEGGKRKHEESDVDEDLEDEDYDLLEENLGIKVQRHQRKRIKKVSDDEEEEEDEGNEKDVIEKEIFDEDDDGDYGEGPSQPRRSTSVHEESVHDDFAELSGEESDENDFIVDDDGRPISQVKKKRHIFHDDACGKAAQKCNRLRIEETCITERHNYTRIQPFYCHYSSSMREAQELFGVDFDFGDLEQLDEEEEEEEEEPEDDFVEEEDEEVEGEARPRAPKPQRKKKKKTTIYEVFEPSDLERGHLTDYDHEIRMADLPERFQQRAVPVSPAEEGELDLEAEWIYKHAFNSSPISRQEYFDQDQGKQGFGGSTSGHKGPGTSAKIREALNLMRNQKFEVPFIAFYRKEYIEPQLNIVDVWRIYKWDEKWMQLQTRKQNLIVLFQQMQQYQFEQTSQLEADKQLSAGFRTLTDEDVDRVRSVQSMDELHDIYNHFQLYYGSDIPKMKAAIKKKKRREQQEANGEEAIEEEEADTLKQATKKSGYEVCVEAGLAELANKFGLTAEQFGENLRDNYQRNEVEQDPNEPKNLAADLINKQFKTVEDVLAGAQHIVAMQLAHDPVVRSCVRQTFYERARITCYPTKKGEKEIDEGHQYYTFKYLKNKPVQDLSDEQYLKLHIASTDDQMLIFELHMDEKDNPRLSLYIDEIRQLYHRDEFSNLVQEWNAQRSAALEKCLTQILYPQLIRELKTKLLEEAKESVIRAGCRRLYNWLKVAPYAVDQPVDDEDEDYDTTHGVRVMALSYTTQRDEASFCAVIDGDGEVIDHLRLPHITKRKLSWNEVERSQKESDLKAVKEFILARKPHVIAVGAENRDATRIIEDLKAVVAELEQEHNLIPINVELIDTELAIIYANSKKSENDMREYPGLLRQAVSLARRLQDPLIEFSQLCNADEDILCLKYHPYQDFVNKDDLLEAIHLEFINRVNEVGVDVNRCIAHPHTASLIQFVCGLGPRKGNHLLKTLKQNNTPLENRTLLVTHQQLRMGPKVFLNCSGFIKINTSALADSTEQYVEVLDGSRIHPETYEWARKMAVDALEYDDSAEDANPAGALEEILESPERLKDLDLDAFAEELERQGYGDKHITLYDIRAELNHRYKDLRIPYRSCTVEERFNLLTKETPQTFYIGKLLTCQVTGIAHKRPQGEQLEVAHPVRNDETGLWQCPFCQKNNFPELSEVWNHFDAGGCPGQAVGVKTRLDNGVNGFIHLRNLSDKHVTNPAERVQVGMMLHARITKIDIDRFQVELTSKSSDLLDADGKWKLQKDAFYDYELEDANKQKEENKKKQQAKQTYVKRVIAHPSFHNIDYRTCEKLMLQMDQGDIIIRPSSKSSDHLTVTWKVAGNNILQHVDVREEKKENSFSIGKCLKIDGDSFEDLDEIIARYIQPMSAFARDVMTYKSYKDIDCNSNMDVIEKSLSEEKMKAPSKIPYIFTPSSKYPGKFLLSYKPRTTCRHEYLTVTPEGFRYRSQMFSSLTSLIKWFKEHFRDPVPGTPMGMGGAKTPGGGTPLGGLHNVDPHAIQRAAAAMPSSMYNTLQQVTGSRTPYGGGGHTPYGQFHPGLSTPMTPGHGPQMRPMGPPPQGSRAAVGYNTPMYHQMNTPRGGPQQYPPGTPGQSPRDQGGRTPRDKVSMDWAKRAQMWAKQKGDGRGTPRRTPHQSPYHTPLGDHTPLEDEDR